LTLIVNAAAFVMVFVSLVQMDERFGGSPPAPAAAIDEAFDPFHTVSPYGLFSVMTTTREEIIVEGSDDGQQWREYEFRYKPGDVRRRPQWTILHQPRLDWQMWFAALDDPQRLPWFSRFLERLLENEPSVTGLVERNPFPDKPPAYVRAELYEYTYAPNDDAAGQWWDRRLAGLYFPKARLNTKDP
jgi:lipase maturation factor 1